jgi:hypothetical protein
LPPSLPTSASFWLSSPLSDVPFSITVPLSTLPLAHTQTVGFFRFWIEAHSRRQKLRVCIPGSDRWAGRVSDSTSDSGDMNFWEQNL